MCVYNKVGFFCHKFKNIRHYNIIHKKRLDPTILYTTKLIYQPLQTFEQMFFGFHFHKTLNILDQGTFPLFVPALLLLSSLRVE